MTDETSTRKADVENWRRGYEAALSGKAFVCAGDEKISAYRLGYRDGRAMRLKLRVHPAEGSTIAAVWFAARQAGEGDAPDGHGRGAAGQGSRALSDR
jgi:hypothetical protein